MRRINYAKWMLLVAMGAISFCSCQTLGSTSGKLSGKSAAQAKPLPVSTTAEATTEKPKGDKFYPGVPAGYAGPLPVALRPSVAPRHAHCSDENCQSCPPQHVSRGGGCPCAGCQGGGSFRFSDSTLDTDPQEPWAPDGLARPWPQDEYLWNGCDRNGDARARRDFTVVGLDPQDTIAHYDTLDGKTETTPANCVPIYAPRFASVRKVINPVLYEGQDMVRGVEKPTKLNLHNETRIATTAVQPLQPKTDVGLDPAIAFRDRTKGIGLERTQPLAQATQGFLPYEDFRTIKFGVYEAGEKARLAKHALAANTWQANQAVQVVIDGQMLVEAKGTSRPEELHVYDLLGKPRLRIVKVASTSEAQVGDEIDFTLRFDNVGDQTIGNVTIIDHLVTRLEYVEGSQQCSVGAEFKTEASDGESLILRWEVSEPLKVGEGGIIRFKCRVR